MDKVIKDIDGRQIRINFIASYLQIGQYLIRYRDFLPFILESIKTDMSIPSTVDSVAITNFIKEVKHLKPRKYKGNR